jgi:hypothetical protein
VIFAALYARLQLGGWVRTVQKTILQLELNRPNQVLHYFMWRCGMTSEKNRRNSEGVSKLQHYLS